MLRLRTVHALVGAMILVLAACGSDPSAPGDGDSGASIDSSHPVGVDSGASDAHASNDAAANDAATIVDSAIQDSALDDGAMADASPAGDASHAPDANAPHDGGEEGGVAHCGNISCTGQNKVCCAQYGGNVFGPTLCVPSACSGPTDTTLECAATADCNGGAVCCLTTVNHNVARCAQACAPGDFAQLCDPKAATSGCPAGKACVEETDHLFIAIPQGQGLCQ